MSVGLDKALATATYSDVKELATRMAQKLAAAGVVTLDAAALADALVEAAGAAVPKSITEEEKILSMIFSRKRTISIECHRRVGNQAAGWIISIPTVPGSNVVGADLRVSIGYMLDQIVAMHVMTDGKGMSK